MKLAFMLIYLLCCSLQLIPIFTTRVIISTMTFIPSGLGRSHPSQEIVNPELIQFCKLLHPQFRHSCRELFNSVSVSGSRNNSLAAFPPAAFSICRHSNKVTLDWFVIMEWKVQYNFPLDDLLFTVYVC